MSVVRNIQEKSHRIAFCGSMGSGKTYASNHIVSQLAHCKKVSVAKPIKDIVARFNKSDRASHIMVGMVGRSLDEDVWVKDLNKRLERLSGNIVVDDIRYENEAKMLKEQGFTIVYLNTPWHVRFKRIRERSDDYLEHVQHFNDPSEVACESIDKSYFDYVWSTPSDVDNGIAKILSNEF